MEYTAEFESNIGMIRAEWDGSDCIYLFTNDSGNAPKVINVWDAANDKPLIASNAQAMAAYVREYLWEVTRGIDFERITYSETDELTEK